MEKQIGPHCEGPQVPISNLPACSVALAKVQRMKSCRKITAAVEGYIKAGPVRSW